MDPITERRKRERKILYASIAIGLLLLGIVNIWFAFVRVNGNSMNNTYKNGTMVLVKRQAEISRGDVVVAVSEGAGQILFKRVIAVGGDTVSINYDTCEVYVNDSVINEPYLKEALWNNSPNEEPVEFPLEIPEGQYFLMGDNRSESFDSRDSRIGCIPREKIAGKVLFRIPLL